MPRASGASSNPWKILWLLDRPPARAMTRERIWRVSTDSISSEHALVACMTGRSADFSPWRIRPTYLPAWQRALVRLALAGVESLLHRWKVEPGLHGLEQLAVEDRLMLAAMHLTPVADLTDVEPVLEQMGERSHAEADAAFTRPSLRPLGLVRMPRRSSSSIRAPIEPSAR